MVSEANQMAHILGRPIVMEAKLITRLPEPGQLDDVLSPVEELYTQKSTELHVQAVYRNARTGKGRSWLWELDQFYERIFVMRDCWMRWMLTQEAGPLRTEGDPFWSPPLPQELGKAYLYLAPLAHRVETSQWLPIVDQSGTSAGVNRRCGQEV